MTYYQEKLDGKILAPVVYGSMVDPENPVQLPIAFHHYLMRGILETGSQRLLCSYEFPSENQPDFNDVSVAIMSDDFDQFQTYFANLEKSRSKLSFPLKQQIGLQDMEC